MWPEGGLLVLHNWGINHTTASPPPHQTEQSSLYLPENIQVKERKAFLSLMTTISIFERTTDKLFFFNFYSKGYYRVQGGSDKSGIFFLLSSKWHNTA
jgi:hypothetical protein